MSNAPKHIYFMKPIGMIGPIKIGCSGWPDERVKQLMVWSPYPLEIVHSFEGGQSTERKLHHCFADLHSHGEWFHPGTRLLKAIEAMKNGTPVELAVDFNDDKGSILNGRCGKRQVPPELVGFLSYSSKLRHAAIKAGKAAGDSRVIPDDVREILRKWEGYRAYRQPRKPVRPNEEQFRRLDEVIADPASHCVFPPWVIRKVAA